MELDNVIYIVITISIFVISLLGQLKKKKVPKPVVQDDVIYSLNDFEKILERKEEYRNTEEQKPESEETADEHHEIEDLQHKHHDKSEKKEHHKEENEINDGFDVKSAIIYSSILERKKFRH